MINRYSPDVEKINLLEEMNSSIWMGKVELVSEGAWLGFRVLHWKNFSREQISTT